MTDKLIIAPGTDPNQYYATKLGLHSPFITLCRGKKRFLAAGGFEYPQAAALYPTTRFEELGKDWKSVIKAFCKKYKIKNPEIPSTTYAAFYKAIPKATLTRNMFAERAVKTTQEIKHIKEAQHATDQAILAVREVLQNSVVKNKKIFYEKKPLTSEYLKKVAAMKLAQYNCSCPEMIISSGAQSALPHHEGKGQLIEGAVIIDIFPKSNETQYYADCTRTYVVGEPPKTFDERYKAVLEVHKRVTKKLKNGFANPEKIAQDTFKELGFITDYKKGTGYIHSLGHGVGLDIHEEPRLSGKMLAGNVITIEPGLYYDYGIRVEDIGLVTKTGYTNFVKIDKNPYLQ